MSLRLCRVLPAFLFAAVALFIVSGPAAAAPPVVTELEIEAPDRVTVGDRIRMVITLDAEAGTEVTLAPGAIPREVSLASVPDVSRRGSGDGREQITMTLEIAPFFLGPHRLEGLRLRYTDAAGAAGEITLPPAELLVASTLPGPDVLPRDLKPQASFPALGTPAWVLVAAGVLAIALFVTLAALLLLRRRRTRTDEFALPGAEVPLGPEDRARRQLDGPAAAHLAAREYGPYYALLSTTVRSYLTERFGFPAFALTTTEMQAQMVRQGMDRWQARIVGGLLEQCDAVVFAGYRPAPERAELDLTAAFEIVEMSRMLDAEPVPVGAPA